MAKRRSRSPAEKVVQHRRTFNNQRVKYQKLIAEFPKSVHVKIWEKLIETYSKI